MKKNIFTRVVRGLSILVFLSLVNRSAAQVHIPERIFYDTVTGIAEGGRVFHAFGDGPFMYASGGYFNVGYFSHTEFPILPAINKVDTAGNLVWTATNQEPYPDLKKVGGFDFAWCEGTIKSGNRLYTIVSFDRNPSMAFSELWSVNDSTGAIVWRNRINEQIIQLADYNNNELVALVLKNNPENSFDCGWAVVSFDKATGAEIFRKTLTRDKSSSPSFIQKTYTIYVDPNKNLLLSHEDTCWKYRDNRFSQLLWTTTQFIAGSNYDIISMTQHESRYIFLGHNHVKAVDTTTGNNLFFRQVPVGVVLPPDPNPQSGYDGHPASFTIRDSLLYVTWVATTVPGNLKRGFTLTRINCINGYMKFNVSYDITGIPADTWTFVNDPTDWPLSLTIDSSHNVYLTGTFDSGNGYGIWSPGNWGIVKINGQSGAKIWEATITRDSTLRHRYATGVMVHYANGKMYCIGNSEQKQHIAYFDPRIVSFDTTGTYTERFRKSFNTGIRYPSSLVSLRSFSNGKMVLLKKVGRSAVLELRTNTDQLLWSQTISRPSRFVEPGHLAITADNRIAISCLSYKQESFQQMYRGPIDSLLFFKFDSLGNTAFSHRMLGKIEDSLRILQSYVDKQNATNFFFLKKCNSCGNGRTAFGGYTVDSTHSILSETILHPRLTMTSYPQTKINPIQHVRGDTMGHFVGGGPSAIVFTRNRQSAGSFTFWGVRRIPKFANIISTVKTDSLTHLVIGNDSSNNAIVMNYRFYAPDSVRWITNFGPGLIYNADTTNTAIYLISHKPDLAMVLTKLDKSNGAIMWQKEFTAPTRSYYVPVDIACNESKNRLTVGGYINDTTTSYAFSSYFIITLDSAGSVIKNETRKGPSNGISRVNAVDVLPSGLTMFGGAVTSAYGNAGFYTSADTAASVITSLPNIRRDDFYLSFFPNPATTDVMLQFNSPQFQKQVSISLLNAAGQRLKTYQLSNITPGLHNQPLHVQTTPGLYFIELRGTGNLRSVKPLVIMQ